MKAMALGPSLNRGNRLDSGETYTLGSPVWSCRWSVGTLTDSPCQTQATQSSERLPYRPSGWCPAVLQSLPGRSRLLCSGNQEEFLWVCIVLQWTSLASHEAWEVFWQFSHTHHTHLWLDHLDEVFFQGGLHSTQLGSHSAAQLAGHGLQALGDRWRERITTRTTNTTIHIKTTKTRNECCANLPDVTMHTTYKYLLNRRWSTQVDIYFSCIPTEKY